MSFIFWLPLFCIKYIKYDYIMPKCRELHTDLAFDHHTKLEPFIIIITYKIYIMLSIICKEIALRCFTNRVICNTHTCACTHTHVHTHTHAHIYWYMHTCTYISIHTHTHTHHKLLINLYIHTIQTSGIVCEHDF